MVKEKELTVAYLAPELGAVTSTFIYREIKALRRDGVRVVPFSTYRPKDAVISEEARPLVAETKFVYDYSKTAIALGGYSGYKRFLRGPLRSIGLGFLTGTDALFERGLSLSDSLKLSWHFNVAHLLADDLEKAGVQHIHAHFAHVPTSIAMYAAMLTGISYSFTAHANDIFERPTLLRKKVARSAFAACVSEYNRRYLIEYGCDPTKLYVVRCGVDVTEYAWREPQRSAAPANILCVGRLVEKKGIAHLIEALSLVRQRGPAFRCRIAGDGPLFAELQAMIAEKSLGDGVELLGSQPQERVRELFRDADLFVLPCVVAKSGDRDGIPVVLMEAMALGVPVISTTISGIPELVHDGENGLLAPPGDAAVLAQKIETLITNRELAARITRHARKTVEIEFNSSGNAALLKQKFAAAIESR
ncbi:MAG: glycosyltransferase [Candidatus Hydrogenedentes bacterium]|nr:glycosyltransferase [Candidatus Hydrogenedentota bacterium]